MSVCTITDLAGLASTLYQVQVPSGHKLRIEGKLLITSTGALQLPSGTTAERPSSPANGYLRYNTTESSVEVYSNGAWVILAGSIIGTESDNPASGPADIIAADPNAVDGVYYFQHGSGGVYQAYVDMQAGGYMLVGKIPASPADTSNPWSYNGARWNQQSTTNESDCQNTNSGDALNRGYYQYTATVGFKLAMNTVNNYFTANRSGVTARQAFTTNSNTSYSRDQFLDWINEAHTEWDNQAHCNRNGWNRTDSSNTAMRFGITMNNENDCNSNDSAIGFGCYTNNQSSSGSRNCAAGGFRWSSTVRYPKNGWIFVK